MITTCQTEGDILGKGLLLAGHSEDGILRLGPYCDGLLVPGPVRLLIGEHGLPPRVQGQGLVNGDYYGKGASREGVRDGTVWNLEDSGHQVRILTLIEHLSTHIVNGGRVYDDARERGDTLVTRVAGSTNIKGPLGSRRTGADILNQLGHLGLAEGWQAVDQVNLGPGQGWQALGHGNLGLAERRKVGQGRKCGHRAPVAGGRLGSHGRRGGSCHRGVGWQITCRQGY